MSVFIISIIFMFHSLRWSMFSYIHSELRRVIWDDPLYLGDDLFFCERICLGEIFDINCVGRFIYFAQLCRANKRFSNLYAFPLYLKGQNIHFHPILGKVIYIQLRISYLKKYIHMAVLIYFCMSHKYWEQFLDGKHI